MKDGFIPVAVGSPKIRVANCHYNAEQIFTMMRAAEREGVKVWKCLNCGHLHVGAEAPEVCPVCNHPKAYFEEQVVNY